MILRGSPVVVETHALDPSGAERIGEISAAGGGISWTTGSYARDGVGNIIGMGSDTFVYDGLSRLTRANLHNRWGWLYSRDYSYDSFGNLTGIGGRSVDAATNRLTGSSYSASDRQLDWGSGPLQYEYAYYPTGQVRQVGHPNLSNPVDHFVYGYTGDGERLVTYRVINGQFQGVRYTIRDLEGHILREFIENDNGATWTWTKDYIWGPTGLLATVSPTGGTKHYVTDHLRSPRLITDRCAHTLAQHNYYPYGEEATYADLDRERIKFTGHERDLGLAGQTTDDLDYMHARYYNLHLGRFLSTDPIGGRIGSSQSWNRYSYVLGNPINGTDPTGMLTNQYGGPNDQPVNISIAGTTETVWDAGFSSPAIWDNTMTFSMISLQVGRALAVLSDSSGGGYSQDAGAIAAALAVFRLPGVRQFFRRLFKEAGWGSSPFERGGWILRKSNGMIGFKEWPWSRAYHEISVPPPPAGTTPVGMAHTHPTASVTHSATTGPDPSSHDEGVADYYSVVSFILSRAAINAYVPAWGVTVHIAGGGWFNQ